MPCASPTTRLPSLYLILALVITAFSALTCAEFPAYSPASADDYDAGAFGNIPTQNLSSTTRFNTTHLLRRKWNARQCDRPGHYYFIDPHGYAVGHNGPEIIDQDGRTVWFGEGFNNSYGIRPQMYKGSWHLVSCIFPAPFWTGR